MTDLLSSFYESLVERFKPFLTLPRVACFLLLTLLTAPNAATIFSVETLTTSIGAATEKITDSMLEIPFGNYIAVAAFVFLLIPAMTSYVVRFLTGVFHVKRGKDLIHNLQEMTEATDSHVLSMRNDQVSALFKRKNRGLKHLARYRALAETLIYAWAAIFLALWGGSTSPSAAVALSVIVVVAFFIVSQKMFFCYMAEIKPYDIISEKLRNISMETSANRI